ncbi:MAG: DUF3999 family protein [Aquabacterium sp.]
MSSPQARRQARLLVLAAATLAASLATALAAAPTADPPRYRHQALLSIERPAPFIELAVPVAVLGAARQPGAADIALQDSTGRALPFAWLPARVVAAAPRETVQDVALFAWPRPQVDRPLPSTVRLRVEGGRIDVQAASGATHTAAQPAAGWLIDLGERKADAPRATALRLQWPDAAVPFTAGFALQDSTDLRQWRPIGGGHVMALRGPAGGAGPSQPRVALPADGARFVRLSWDAGAAPPPLRGAQAVFESAAEPTREAPLVLTPKPVPAPTQTASTGPGAAAADAAEAARAARSVHLDLGAALDLQSLTLRFAAGNRVVPVQVQSRLDAQQPWRDEQSTVLYRLERSGGQVDVPPALALATRARWLRVLPDERAGPLDGAALQIEVQARQPRLVFVAQGAPPYRLKVGAAGLPASPALGIEQLVPKLDDERSRFGRATLADALEEDPAAAAAEASEQRWARWRPVLLWVVLIGGVLGLGAMVWRLARKG